MYVHILKTGSRFMCGLSRDGARSFLSLETFFEGNIKPSGTSQWCPICKAAADKEPPCATSAPEPRSPA